MGNTTNHHIFFMAFFTISKILGNILMNPEHLGFHMDYLLLKIETISRGDAKLKKNLVNIINNLIK